MAGGGTEAAAGKEQIAVLGGGCFWCVEAVFAQVPGVRRVVSGYAGGHLPDPTYQQVCAGTTGHAEVVQITFDPERLSYRDILEIFFSVHDPTTPNRQGADVGPQYRSIILYRDEDQAQAARQLIAELDASGRWEDPIVTEVVPLTAFYEAEPYHRNFYARNPDHPYCRAVIGPKLDAFRKAFARD